MILMKIAGDIRKKLRISIEDVSEATNCEVENLLKIEDGFIDDIDPVAYLYYLNLYMCNNHYIKPNENYIDFILFEI